MVCVRPCCNVGMGALNTTCYIWLDGTTQVYQRTDASGIATFNSCPKGRYEPSDFGFDNADDAMKEVRWLVQSCLELQLGKPGRLQVLTRPRLFEVLGHQDRVAAEELATRSLRLQAHRFDLAPVLF